MSAEQRTVGRLWGAAALAGAAVIWGSTYVVIKGVLDDIGPLTLALLRFLVVLPVLVPVAVRAGLRVDDLRLPVFWVFGGTGVAIYFGLQNLGLVFTTAGSAALIAAAIPAATAVISFLVLGERPSSRRWGGIIVSTVGVVLIVGSGLELGAWEAVLGNLLVLASAVAWAAYTVQGRRLGETHPALVSTGASFLTGSVLLVPLAGAEIALTGWLNPTPAVLGAVVYLGVVASGLAIVLWNAGVRLVEASAAGTFTNLVPLVGLAFAVGVGEAATALQLVGGALALVGVFIAQRDGLPSPKRTPPEATGPLDPRPD